MGISQLKKVVKTCLAIKVLVCVCGVLKKTAEVDRKLLLNETPQLHYYQEDVSPHLGSLVKHHGSSWLSPGFLQ